MLVPADGCLNIYEYPFSEIFKQLKMFQRSASENGIYNVKPEIRKSQKFGMYSKVTYFILFSTVLI